MFSYRPSARYFSSVLIGVVLSFIPALGSVPSVLAVGNLQLGPVELHPFFQISELFDDNVCRTEAKLCPDPQNSAKTKDGEDQITIFSPGLQLMLPFQDHRFQAEYRGDFGRYTVFKTENYSDNTIKGDLAFNFPGGLSILLKDDWKSGHDPRGFAQNVDLDFYHRNTAGAELGLRVGPKLRLAFNFKNLDLNYQDDARNGFRDRTDNTVGGTVYYKFLQKTSALLEYDYTAVNFDKDNTRLIPGGTVALDSKAQRAYLGLTWAITTRSQGTLKGGYTRKEFQESGLTDFKGGIVSLVLNHELTTRTSVRLDADRDVRESNLATQPYYLSAGGRLELVHLIHSSVTAKLKGGFFRDQYPTIGTQVKKRLDDTWNAGAGLAYHPRNWLNLGLGYDHSQRRSVIDGFGYIDNLYTFNLGVVL